MHGSTSEEVLPIDVLQVRRALLSVSDKSGLLELAKGLAAHNVELYSTGGTEKFLRDAGLAVTSVSDLTKFPEMLDGRVKTLHPNVHGGLLYRRELRSHQAQVEEHGIEAIDLLVVNLYPFEETVAKPNATQEEVIEQIDIGGPAMLRSAAKNFKGVALLTAPDQYSGFLNEIEKHQGQTSLAYRFELAAQAFRNVAKYDVAIANYFDTLTNGTSGIEAKLQVSLSMQQPLRYGENPQQHAALYSENFNQLYEQLWGKELSYNNILDSSAAVGLIAEFLTGDRAVAAIIKHTNPCGVGEGETIEAAFERAFQADPESPFGGIIIVNRPFTAALASRVNEFFSEVILAPSFEEGAMEILKKKKDRRLIRFTPEKVMSATKQATEMRSVIGGVLVQEIDARLYENPELTATTMTSVTSRQPSTEECYALDFAWKVVKHVKSNAIVYVKITDGYAGTVGIGCGQTSRVESSRLAVHRAKQFGHSLEGSVVASDAFFPFADGLIEAADAGAVAAIEPGGSVRDTEVIAAAEVRKMALVMTGMRHFKH